VSRAASLREQASVSRRSSLETLHEHDRSPVQTQVKKNSQISQASAALPAHPRRQTVKRHSSLRHQTKPSEVTLDAPRQHFHTLNHAASDSQLSAGKVRPKSHPPPSTSPMAEMEFNGDGNSPTPTTMPDMTANDPWLLPPLPRSMPQTPKLTHSAPSRAPSLTFRRLSSLDQLITYREDRESWKRESFVSAQQLLVPAIADQESIPPVPPLPSATVTETAHPHVHAEKSPTPFETELRSPPNAPIRSSKFRHVAAEVGFCFTIAMTQLLAEYLISGFAIVLPNMFIGNPSDGTGMTGLFWPAALLTLILSAFLLVFARVSDMYGGYGPFMFGIIWLAIWTLIPGFISSSLLLNVSRAMQGLAIAAYTPSTFAMVGSIYSEGPRRNIVLGLYGACAPLGLYTGFLSGGALPVVESRWYFWIASVLAFITAITAYLSVPHDRTDRERLNLKMDWLGAGLITSGLILVTYALSVQPYANVNHPEINGFAFRIVWAPLSTGTACLAVAFWVEGWYASCPLLPFEFFKPPGIKAFCIACLFFYGSFGVWLYMSAEYFVSPVATQNPESVKGIMLSLWYTPMAVGGMIFCVVGSSVLHIVPIKLLLVISGMAWIAAPLIFAVGSIPLNYWAEVLPSMICGTLGIDLTLTIAAIFLSSSQPLKFQGVAGAVSSILVNLAMSFSLPISLIVKEAAVAHVATDTIDDTSNATIWGFRAAFIYGTVSAACGLIIVIFFVKISRSVVSEREQEDEEASPRIQSWQSSTFVPAADALRSESV
jgi:MFS family permease